MSNRLKQIREARGLRREEIASSAGISYGYVRLLEAEDPPVPSIEIARRIAVALESDLDQVFPPSEAAGPLVAPSSDPSVA